MKYEKLAKLFTTQACKLATIICKLLILLLQEKTNGLHGYQDNLCCTNLGSLPGLKNDLCWPNSCLDTNAYFSVCFFVSVIFLECPSLGK